MTNQAGPEAPARVALVTGAASGLGAAIGRALAATGWFVAGLDLRDSATDLSIPVDVTDAAAVTRAVQKVHTIAGRIDALVTVAGVYEVLPVVEITVERWKRMLSVNIAGTVNAVAAVIPGMIATGAGKRTRQRRSRN